MLGLLIAASSSYDARAQGKATPATQAETNLNLPKDVVDTSKLPAGQKGANKRVKTCAACQKEADLLQSLLDAYFSNAYNNLKATAQGAGSDAGQAQTDMQALTADWFGGSAGRTSKADAVKKKQDAKDPNAPADDPEKLKQQIKDAVKALQACLPKCAPQSNQPAVTTPGPEKPPQPPPPGANGQVKVPEQPEGVGDVNLPTLPAAQCWSSAAEKDAFDKQLQDAVDKLDSDAKEVTSHGGPPQDPNSPRGKLVAKIKENQEKAKKLKAGADAKACPKEQRSMLPGFKDEGSMVVPPQRPEYVSNPGEDVRKNDILLTDTTTQKEIPGGQVVIIPADPRKPIPPPIRVTSTGKVTLPETQPEDHIVLLPDDHQKVELAGGDLPTDKGDHIAVPQRPRRMIVHDTPCSQVIDVMVAEGLADQYGESPERGWIDADYRFADSGAVTNCMISVPQHRPLHPGEPQTEGGAKAPKDGPTRTHDGKIIEGDQPREIQGPPPTEPFATSQGSWGQGYPDQWYLHAVRWLKDDGSTVLPQTGSPVTVAVIDTGVDFSHTELAEAKWINPSPSPRGDVNGWNFVDQSADMRDFSGHGTIVAGLIAASATDKFGIAGINPWAHIMALKALEIDGKGGSINLAQAIVYAADHGARVINLSVGGRTLTRMEQEAIDYAARRNALVVVASGNDGIETRNFSPAGLHNVLAVAAVGPDLKRQGFSNWGTTIGIAAPGVDILSLRAHQTDLLEMTRRDYKPGTAVVADQFYRVTGSSFAAPIVSGAASLLLSAKPDLTAAQVKRMLLQSARDLEGVGIDQFSGYGLLDVEAALAADPNRYAEAAITSVAAVQARGGTVVRVTGTADADALEDAHIETGPGDNPARWTTVSRPLTKPVLNGMLADLPAAAFRGGKIWTLRVIVTNRSGLRREARFKLTLG